MTIAISEDELHKAEHRLITILQRCFKMSSYKRIKIMVFEGNSPARSKLYWKIRYWDT